MAHETTVGMVYEFFFDGKTEITVAEVLQRLSKQRLMPPTAADASKVRKAFKLFASAGLGRYLNGLTRLELDPDAAACPTARLVNRRIVEGIRNLVDQITLDDFEQYVLAHAPHTKAARQQCWKQLKLVACTGLGKAVKGRSATHPSRWVFTTV